MNQVFAVWQVSKQYLANGKDVFWALMNLEKAYDTIWVGNDVSEWFPEWFSE